MDENIMIQEVFVGKTYLVTHLRKGRFLLRITAIYEHWVTGILVEEDEELTIRREFSSFKELQP